MNSQWNAELHEGLKGLSSRLYNEAREPFLTRLTDYERRVYREVTQLPYDVRNWYRDLHDIVVTGAALMLSETEGLPRHLVLAAILHDRGYALLDRADSERLPHASEGKAMEGYFSAVGAFWESPDARLLHSRMSREIAEVVVCGRPATPLLVGITPKLAYVSGGPCSNDEQEEVLQVIEEHDLALIGEYERLSPLTRAHFDVDSLYSISAISFLKDYLSYVEDRKKEEALRSVGIHSLEPRDLLLIRMARYYESPAQLPAALNQGHYPLTREYVTLNETRRCIRPHSAWAEEATDNAFLRLAEICTVIREHPGQVDEVLEEVERSMVAALQSYGRL
jgi:hypothetical protein